MKWMHSVALAVAMGMGLVCSTAVAGSRPGVVIDLQPIENRGDDESTTTKRGRALGEKIGSVFGVVGGGRLMRSDNRAISGAGNIVGGNGGAIGSEVGAKVVGDGPTTRYMVKVRLDSGKTLSLTQLHEQVNGLKAGSRVRVEGTGDSALIFGE